VDDDPDLGGDGDLDRPGKCLVSASEGRLVGRRILVTSARTYMGPAIASLFRAEGADVIADDDPLTEPGAPAALVDRCGHLDAVVANLDLPAYGAGVVDIDDEPRAVEFDGLDMGGDSLADDLIPLSEDAPKGCGVRCMSGPGPGT
jgi:hypothetical protein